MEAGGSGAWALWCSSWHSLHATALRWAPNSSGGRALPKPHAQKRIPTRPTESKRVPCLGPPRSAVPPHGPSFPVLAAALVMKGGGFGHLGYALVGSCFLLGAKWPDPFGPLAERPRAPTKRWLICSSLLLLLCLPPRRGMGGHINAPINQSINQTGSWAQPLPICWAGSSA